ncbi:MAG: glucoamylase family protein, partial [Burkholderiales bacterium]
MRAHGRQLALTHELAEAGLRNPLLGRLKANQSELQEVAQLLSAAVGAGRAITPAGEWLLDNYYLIEEEIATAKRHLPARYSRELPRLKDDASLHDADTDARQPRIYDLALNAVAHGDGRVVMHTLSLFVGAYQTHHVLTLGELWAFPIMLRLALIENLRRIGVAVADNQRSRESAELWAERMLESAHADPPSDLVLIVADLARSGEALDASFVAELARRLQGRGAAMTMPLSWLEQRLQALGRTLEAAFVDDSREQAEWQLSVASSIGSLRLVDAGDWSEFVENASFVDHSLRKDPAGVYAHMDFTSRDAYRHAVERFARRSGKTELAVAREVLALATGARDQAQGQTTEQATDFSDNTDDARGSHVGYYLVANGHRTLERRLGLKPSWSATAMLRAHTAAVTLLTLVLSFGPAWFVWQHAAFAFAPDWLGWMFLPVLLLGASQLAVALVNWAATLLVAPRMLARLDFSKGIAPTARTLVVVPTLLTRAETVDSLLDALERHYLANRDPQLRFALLSDLRDAKSEAEAGDDALVERAAAGIANLNARYAPPTENTRGSRDIFFLLHRPRRFNAREGVWMGHERKRGKLSDLNALLRGRAGVGPGKAFARSEGHLDRLSGVRFVITLDSDTELPHGSATQMVATIAHPLQRPRFGVGACAGLVVDGHAILQPRSQPSLPSTLRSRQARLFGGDAGTDPYTRAVSDVYQDLFDEGSYFGKGIYDVDAFERALAGRLPDNRVLSHDLIEGCHARAGLLSDVTLFEQVPHRYAAEVARIHRWTRGDWQLLPWLFGRVGALPGRPLNILSPLSRLKLFDNLRRSLVPPALMLVLLLGWVMLPGPALWSLLVVAVFGLVPMLAQAGAALRIAAVTGSSGWGGLRNEAFRLIQRAALLPDESRNLLDAIGRTLWRVGVSGRHLLEWTASTELPSGAPAGSAAALRETVRQVWSGPVLALAVIALLAATRPQALPAAAPWLALSALAPLLVWWLDQSPARRTVALTADDRRYLRSVARRTWAFFEDHVNAENHYLPPDNVQLQPGPRVAHRTSPTNIGMALLAPLVARDLGYLLLSQVVSRIDAQIGALEGLARHRGHFFNWYDTQTLQPLAPRYVSSVDSGNLAASLLVLRSALLELADEPLSDVRWCEGIRDTLDLYRAADSELAENPHYKRLAERVEAYCGEPSNLLSGGRELLVALHEGATDLAASIASHVSAAEVRERSNASMRWAQALTLQCRVAIEEIGALLPAEGLASAADRPMPSLRALAADPHAPRQAAELLSRLEGLAARAFTLCEMDYAFLFDANRHMLHIGWHVDEQRADAGFYDLLASEARLGVYVAIAQARLPAQAWFALGRGLSLVDGRPTLLSWSGSMFEYLMPALLMPQYEDTLLGLSCESAVRRQVDYGNQRSVPWGISESGYNAIDSTLNYQYRAFGVPGLGLKRGLGEDLVIAPYATVMALIVDPVRAVANLRRLGELGADDDYGFFEALDFTRSRLPPDKPFAVVRQYMAHHQGMALLAMGQVLTG